jgi:hypothetical protein
MMSREDVLRELELLPVWQLRNPVVIEKKADSLPTAQHIEQESEGYQAEPHAPESVTFRLIASEDGQWLFALAPQQNEVAETLFHNMLKAVAVKIGQDVTKAQPATIADFTPKVIVAMGETIAQQLLTAQPLTQLRGAVHRLKEVPLVVTYAPDDLLQYPASKASAWEDLCLAKSIIADLTSD